MTPERATLPRPGASHLDNLIATMLLAGNRSASLKGGGLDRIAHYQGFDPAEFRARFAELEWLFSQVPPNACEDGGK